MNRKIWILTATVLFLTLTLTVYSLALSSNPTDGIIHSSWKILDPEKQTKYWIVERQGGNYSVEKNTLILTSTGEPYDYVLLYKALNATGDFTIRLEVMSPDLGAFCVKLAKSKPFFGSVECITFEMTDTVQGKGFQIARWVNGWTWETFAQPQTNVWYRLEIEVHKEPFRVIYKVYEGRELYGMAQADDMTNISFEEIKWIVLECWSNPSEYQIKHFKLQEA